MTTPRIAPASPPFPERIAKALDATMPAGTPPLVLFTTLARDERLFGKFFAGGLLDRGWLTLRQREIVIHRVTAQCGSTYEFGVHAAFFADRVGLGEAELQALAHGDEAHGSWSEEERILIRLCDALHATCDVGDALWRDLSAHFSEGARMELLLLAGFYRTVSYLTNGLRLPAEPFARAFPARA